MIRLIEITDKTYRKGTGTMKENRYELNKQLAQMLKGGVIMDVTTPEQAKIAEEAGACAVMALERIPADIRAAGGVSRMSDPKMIRGIQEAVLRLIILMKAKYFHRPMTFTILIKKSSKYHSYVVQEISVRHSAVSQRVHP